MENQEIVDGSRDQHYRTPEQDNHGCRLELFVYHGKDENKDPGYMVR